MRDAAPKGWSTQLSRTTSINTERESREGNTGKQKRKQGRSRQEREYDEPHL